MFLSLLLALSIQDDSPQVGLRYGSPEADPGYILIAPLKSKSTFLVKKADGEVAHHWQSNQSPQYYFPLQMNLFRSLVQTGTALCQ